MLKYHPSITVAKKVLQAIKRHKDYIYTDGTIKTYNNGREQGFSIANWNRINMDVCFSENRGSDSIVVYSGYGVSKELTEEAYKHAKYFDPGDYKKAADYIVQYLIRKG